MMIILCVVSATFFVSCDKTDKKAVAEIELKQSSIEMSLITTKLEIENFYLKDLRDSAQKKEIEALKLTADYNKLELEKIKVMSKSDYADYKQHKKFVDQTNARLGR